jgi:hypothetical protein
MKAIKQVLNERRLAYEGVIAMAAKEKEAKIDEELLAHHQAHYQAERATLQQRAGQLAHERIAAAEAAELEAERLEAERQAQAQSEPVEEEEGLIKVIPPKDSGVAIDQQALGSVAGEPTGNLAVDEVREQFVDNLAMAAAKETASLEASPLEKVVMTESADPSPASAKPEVTETVFAAPEESATNSPPSSVPENVSATVSEESAASIGATEASPQERTEKTKAPPSGKKPKASKQPKA